MEGSPETDPKVILPQMANLLGLGPIPKPRWMPKWWYKRKKRRQMEQAVSQWKPVHINVPKEVVAMQIAMELRDFAEMVLGYSHVDPEKSAIARNPRRVGKTRWLQHFKYEPPKRKKVSERKQRRVVRRAMREVHTTLQQMGTPV
ncbi:MAG: hypothetical protein ACXAC5_02960 [Promethearchaeota archaeon]|jgi:hypothetical protein